MYKHNLLHSLAAHGPSDECTGFVFSEWMNCRYYIILTEPNSCLFSVSGLPEATITVTQKKVKEVMALEDETFFKFYRQVEELPITTSKMEIDNDFDAIFGPQMPK